MKRMAYLFIFVLLIGCAYEGEKISNYLENPRSIIRDPHFTNYKESLEDLELQYIRKEIDYVEYTDQKKQLDDDYARDVQSRSDVIEVIEGYNK